MMTGIEMLHVPYRGGAPALTDLMGGQVQVYFSPLPRVDSTQSRAGKVRACGGDHCKALGGIARSADHRRDYLRLRGKHVARHRRASKTRPTTSSPRSTRK